MELEYTFLDFDFFIIVYSHTWLPATLRFRRKRRNRNVAVVTTNRGDVKPTAHRENGCNAILLFA